MAVPRLDSYGSHMRRSMCLPSMLYRLLSVSNKVLPITFSSEYPVSLQLFNSDFWPSSFTFHAINLSSDDPFHHSSASALHLAGKVVPSGEPSPDLPVKGIVSETCIELGNRLSILDPPQLCTYCQNIITIGRVISRRIYQRYNVPSLWHPNRSTLLRAKMLSALCPICAGMQYKKPAGILYLRCT
jgi:hypothetical protein